MRKIKTGWTCGGQSKHSHRWYWTAFLCGWIQWGWAYIKYGFEWIQWGWEWIKYPFALIRYYYYVKCKG